MNEAFAILIGLLVMGAFFLGTLTFAGIMLFLQWLAKRNEEVTFEMEEEDEDEEADWWKRGGSKN